ncbi:hypothetical protein ACFW2K_18720 [Streptomyces nigra]
MYDEVALGAVDLPAEIRGAGQTAAVVDGDDRSTLGSRLQSTTWSAAVI